MTAIPTYRISIRNVDPDIADLFRETAWLNGLYMGDAFDEAVLTWCDSLSEADGDDDPGET